MPAGQQAVCRGRGARGGEGRKKGEEGKGAMRGPWKKRRLGQAWGKCAGTGQAKKKTQPPFLPQRAGVLYFLKKEATIEKIKKLCPAPGRAFGGAAKPFGPSGRRGRPAAIACVGARVCGFNWPGGRTESSANCVCACVRVRTLSLKEFELLCALVACARVCGCGRPFRPMRQWPMRLAQQRKRRGRAGVGACARMAGQRPHTGAGAAGVCAPEPPCSHRGMPCAPAFALRGGGVPE